MNWIKNNWFKIIIAILLFVIALSIFYYFVLFIPYRERNKTYQLIQEQYLEQQEKCREAGIKAYKEDSLRYGTNNMIEPYYVYNKELNLCLYSGGYSSDDLSSGLCGDILKHACKSFWERWVKNSFTNEKIIGVVNFTNDNGEYTADQETINEFWEKHDQLIERR